MHYQRWYRHGDPFWEPPPHVVRYCSEAGCERRVKARGLCTTHYSRLRQTESRGSAAPKYRQARYAERRGVVLATCKNPECGKSFERPNKPGHPPGYCSDECRRDAACLRTRIWDKVNVEYRAERREATREERNRRSRERYAEDAEYRRKALEHALRRARRPDKRALRALRSALVRGSREGELVTYEELYERDGGVCQLCLAPVPFTDVTMDHVIPCVKGGSHILANLVIAHATCNARKSRK